MQRLRTWVLLVAAVVVLGTAVNAVCPYAHLGHGMAHDRRLQRVYDAEVSLLQLKEKDTRQNQRDELRVRPPSKHQETEHGTELALNPFYMPSGGGLDGEDSSDDEYEDHAVRSAPKDIDGAPVNYRSPVSSVDSIGSASGDDMLTIEERRDPGPWSVVDDMASPPFEFGFGVGVPFPEEAFDFVPRDAKESENTDASGKAQTTHGEVVNDAHDSPVDGAVEASSPYLSPMGPYHPPMVKSSSESDLLRPRAGSVTGDDDSLSPSEAPARLERRRSLQSGIVGTMHPLSGGGVQWLRSLVPVSNRYLNSSPSDRTKILKDVVYQLAKIMNDKSPDVIRSAPWAAPFKMICICDSRTGANSDVYDIFTKKNGFSTGYVSTKYGFLPPEFPLTKLKYGDDDSAVHPLDAFFAKLKDYIREGTIRDKVKNDFPDFDVDSLDPKEWGRAWMILGSIVNGFINLDRRNVWVDPRRIPDTVARPFWKLHRKMGKDRTNPMMTWPVLTYYDMVLQNFEVEEMTNKLMQTYLAFLGDGSISPNYNGPKHVTTMGQWASSASNGTNICERVFYTTMVKMHWDGRDIPATVARIQQLISIYEVSLFNSEKEFDEARKSLIAMISDDIKHLIKKLELVTGAFQTGMAVTSDPKKGCSHMDWYMNVAPWAQGPDPIVWARQYYDDDDLPLCSAVKGPQACQERLDCVYDGNAKVCEARSAVGPSGLQFPITNLMDAFISRQIYSSPIGKGAVLARQYLAPYHKIFVNLVDQGPSLRDFVTVSDLMRDPLRLEFNNLVDVVKKFLQVHNLKAAGFLLEGITKAEGRVTGTSGQMANKAKAESEKTKEDVTTGIMRFLNAGVPERETARVRAYRKYSVEWNYDMEDEASGKSKNLRSQLKELMDNLMTIKVLNEPVTDNIVEYNLVPVREMHKPPAKLTYYPGATVRVFCKNDNELVVRTIRALSVPKYTTLWLKSAPWFEAAGHPDADVKGVESESSSQDGPGARLIRLVDFLALANLRPWNCQLGRRFVQFYNSIRADDWLEMDEDDCERDMASENLVAGYDFADYLAANKVWQAAKFEMRMQVVKELPEMLAPQRTRQYSLANNAQEEAASLPLTMSTVQYKARKAEFKRIQHFQWTFGKGAKKGVCSQRFYQTARNPKSSDKNHMHISVDDALANDWTFTGSKKEYLPDLENPDFKVILFAGGSGLGPMWSVIQYRLRYLKDGVTAQNTWLMLGTKNLMGGVPFYKEMKRLAQANQIRVSIALSGEKTCTLLRTKSECERDANYLRCEWEAHDQIDRENMGKCKELDHGPNLTFYPGCRLTECKKDLRHKKDGWYQFPLLHDAGLLYEWTETLFNATTLATTSGVSGSMLDMSSRMLEKRRYNVRMYLCGSMPFQNSITEYLTKLVQMSTYPSIEMARIVVNSWMKAGAYRIEAFSDDQKFQGMDRTNANQVSMVYTEMEVKAESRWMVYDNTVIDVSSYLAGNTHPGGNSQIESYLGQDITDVITSLQHPVSAILNNARIMGRLVSQQEKDKLKRQCEISMDISEEIIVCEENDTSECTTGARKDEWNLFMMKITSSKDLDAEILEKVFRDTRRRDRIKSSKHGEPVILMYPPTVHASDLDSGITIQKKMLYGLKYNGRTPRSPPLAAEMSLAAPPNSKVESPGGFTPIKTSDIGLSGLGVIMDDIEAAPETGPLVITEPKPGGHTSGSAVFSTGDTSSAATPEWEFISPEVQSAIDDKMDTQPIHSFSFDDITSVPALLDPIYIRENKFFPFRVKRRVFKGRHRETDDHWLDAGGGEIVFNSDVEEHSLIVCFTDERKRNAFAALITSCVNSMYKYQPLDPMNTFRNYLVQRRRTEFELESETGAELKGLDGSISKRAEKVKDLLLKVIQGVDDTVTSSLTTSEAEEETEDETALKKLAGLSSKEKLDLSLPDLGFGWLRTATQDDRFSMGIKDTGELLMTEQRRQPSYYGDEIDSHDLSAGLKEAHENLMAELASKRKGSPDHQRWSTDEVLAYILSQQDDEFEEHMNDVDSAVMEDDSGVPEYVTVRVGPGASEFEKAMSLNDEERMGLD